MELQLTTTQRAVCVLLRAALFDGPKEIPEQTDLNAVCREMAEQCVLALPGDILKELEIPEALRQLWTNTIKRQAFTCYHLIAEQSGRTRNELLIMGSEFALRHMELEDS